MNYAREERAALCTLLADAGPDAPTLCAGWRTRDLAAHLVVREHRLDAAAGFLGGPLAQHARRVHQATAAGSYARLVAQIRAGPPRLSPLGVPWVDERANLVEFFVHHEDVRRAVPGWEPRELSSGVTEALWQRLRMARFIMRKVAVGLELARDDLPAVPGRRPVRMTARAKMPMVTVTGHPAELTMWALGRVSAARVRLDGAEADVKRLEESTWRL